MPIQLFGQKYGFLPQQAAIDDPFEASDYELWYDASDASTLTFNGNNEVTAMNDKSPNGRNLIAPFNPVPLGSQQNEKNTLGIGGDTVNLAQENAFLIDTTEFVAIYIGIRTGGSNHTVDMRGTGDTTLAYRLDSGDIFVRDISGDTERPSINQTSSFAIHTVRSFIDPEDSLRKVVSYTNSSITDNLPQTSSTTAYEFTSFSWGGSVTAIHDAAEFRFIDGTITDNQLDDLLVFLENKWGIS